MNVAIGANVLTHLAYNVLTVTLNGPESVNIVNHDVRQDLQQIFTSAEENEDVRAIILTGGRQNFSAGSDLEAMENLSKQAVHEQMQDIRNTALAIARCHKPVIAAIEGHAAGAGLGLALLCDKILASKTARFTFSFSRIGLSSEWGLSMTLQDRVGRPRARKLLWEGSKLDADTALEYGLIDKICLPETSIDIAWMEAKLLANKSALLVQSIKQYFRLPLDELSQALENEAQTQTKCLMSEEFFQGLNEYRSRRRTDSSN